MKHTLYYFLVLLVCVGLWSVSTHAQTTLSPGDVAILYVQADGSASDRTGTGQYDAFDFVFLIDVDQNTVINFTDGGWNGSALRAGENGVLTYTVPSGGHSAGTVIQATFDQSNNSTISSPSSGMVDGGGGNISLSTSGDQIIAYTGTFGSPSFVAVAMTNSNQFQSGSDDANQSDLPSGLVNGLSAVAAGAGIGAEEEFDNVYYDGALTAATKNEWLERIGNNSNWVGNNSLPAADINYGSSLSVNDATVSESVSLASDRWHMLANPFRNVNVAAYLTDGWTQGFTGSDEASFGESNVYTFTESSNGGEYTEFTSENLSFGQGFIYYYYLDADNNAGTADDNSFALNTTSETFAAHNTVALAHTDNDVSSSVNGDEAWHLLGNPFEADLSVNAIITELQTVDASANTNVYVWDPTTSAFVIKANGGSETVSTGQGFFVRLGTNGASGDFEFNYATMNTTGATFLKQNTASFAGLDMELSMGELRSDHKIRFSEGASADIDPRDAYYLTPLANNYISLFSATDEAKLAINYLPSDLEETIRIPVHIASTESGAARLSWTPADLPQGFDLHLEDNSTGNVYDLSVSGGIDTELIENVTKSKVYDRLRTGNIPQITDSNTPDFELVVTPVSSVNNERESSSPEAFTLDQNYPNPFNPTTKIRYTVPNNGRVQLSIYNVMGQKIATLVDKMQNPGSYVATWNATNNTSGIYYYRLENAGQSVTRQMTLIK